MSYHFHLEIDTGGSEPLCFGPDNNNYTCNVGGMFHAALKAVTDGRVGQMYDRREGDTCDGLDGMNCGDAAVIVKAAYRWLEDHPNEMRAMNPPNGWGNYEGAMAYFRSIYEWCECHPKATLRIT